MCDGYCDAHQLQRNAFRAGFFAGALYSDSLDYAMTTQEDEAFRDWANGSEEFSPEELQEFGYHIPTYWLC